MTINFSSPYFEDKLIWKNPMMKSLGYDIENGKDSIVVNYVSVDKRFTKNLPNIGSKKQLTFNGLNKKWHYYFENISNRYQLKKPLVCYFENIPLRLNSYRNI